MNAPFNPRDIAYCLIGGATSPFWARKARKDWKPRFGHADDLGAPGPNGRLMLHAVSVGEVNALRTLVPLLLERDGAPELVISVGTDTGIDRARRLYADRAAVVRYPLDFSRSVRRFLDAVKPTAVALVELELWPNFIDECDRRGVPVCVINGRLSARSYKGYSRIKGFIGPSFAKLAFAAVQDEDYARRFEDMGVRASNVLLTGSMKWDAAPEPGQGVSADAVQLAETFGIDRDRPLIVAGSTGPTEGGSEEALLHAACPPGVQLACAPRKPERFDDAAGAMPGCVRRSKQERGPADRYLLDTIGELRSLYELADLVVVGRSFGSLHGSDPIEPIALGKPTVIGPAVGDFEAIVAAFESGALADDGIARTSPESLRADLARWMSDPGARETLSRNGLRTVAAHRGASARHAELLASLVAGPADEQPAEAGRTTRG